MDNKQENATVRQESLVELHHYLRQLVSPDQLGLSKYPDFARVEAYWHIGRIIVESEQEGQARADYGVQLIETLSSELTAHYGKGYKTTNLWWFRQFYVEFPMPDSLRGELGIDLRQQLRTELTWTHYRLLVAITDKAARHFYLHAAADEGWSYRTLQKLVRSRYYYQVALGENMLLPLTTKRSADTTATTYRSRLGQARQFFQNLQGWAIINRSATTLTMSKPKPDLLLYNYLLQRFVGVWFQENAPATVEFIRGQLLQWNSEQPKQVSKSPVGLLITAKNDIQVVLSVTGSPLSVDEKEWIPAKLY